MLKLRTHADVNNPVSLSNQMRAKRFEFFEKLAAPLPRPLSIIDIGGTPKFWELCGWAGRHDVHITLINLTTSECKHSNIEIKVGNATSLADYADQSFDIAYSNSVIEHLFTYENQASMAREVQRVGRAYWVQTPNYWFPIEPHFQIPGWQWLPVPVRVAIIRRYTCGWRGPYPDPEQAKTVIEEVRLMTRRELSQLFLDASIRAECFYGLVKSWIAFGGFPRQLSS